MTANDFGRMPKLLSCPLMAFVAAVIFAANAIAGPNTLTNPPECDPVKDGCGCQPQKKVTANCIKVNLDLGVTTPWTGSMPCSLKIFADDSSSAVFTPDSIYAVLNGYTYKRLGQKTMSDGFTPAEVVLSHPNGEPVHFVFENDESLGRPAPGIHIEMDERLMMVDAEGWATISDPVYYDLYVGDGSRRRFLATNMTGRRGSLVSITDAHGKTMTQEDMGIDIIYDGDGVRQFLTPSRLANITLTDEYKGYDVDIYALQDAPAKDSDTGLYMIPSSRPIEKMTIRPENNGKRAIVTIRSSDAEPQRYEFDYVMDDWSLTRQSGVQEQKERLIAPGEDAQISKRVISSNGNLLSQTVKNYKWMSWGFAMTNRVEGFNGITDTTEWTYYTSGANKGQLKTEKRQSGLLVEYTYDSENRTTSVKRSGPDMMTEVMTYAYESVVPMDVVPPVDDRPRTVVRTLDGIECERTYYVYSPLTNIVARIGEQGAAYGSANALRTVTTFYPVITNDLRSSMAKTVRHEDGRIDSYDYSLVSNVWTETITHLHEQALEPLNGKTTRDVTLTNARGEVLEQRTEAYVGDAWHTISRERFTHNSEGKVTRRENLAGQVTTTDWDCCHKVCEVQPDGSTTTWDYDDEGRMTASSRLIPLDMTNVTWLTSCYEYDDLGRQTTTWQTNYAAQVGIPATRTQYDALGRVSSRLDHLGNTTTTTYSPDGRNVSVLNPNTSTRVTTRSISGDVLSITGTAVTPEFHTYGILSNGTRWHKTVQGETASSPRFTKRYENMLGQTTREERSGFQGAIHATAHSYDSLGRLITTAADYDPTVDYTYDMIGNRIATTRSADNQWRKTETTSSIAFDNGEIWLSQTNIASCSDTNIAPLVTSSARQLTGLTSHSPSYTTTTDVRGNTIENWLSITNFSEITYQRVPYATNIIETKRRYGIPVMDVSVSVVTNAFLYDSLGRQCAYIDGRGNTSHKEYNAYGQLLADIDALGNRTTYAYDRFGNLAAVTNALGNAVVYEYDLSGRKTYEGGATYPVRYTYDVFGNKTTMMTYRDESLGPDSGDVTTWFYDEASGCMTNKVYADGKGPTYSYTPDGKLAQRIWARGIVTDYSYDGWNNLTNTTYSDDTPTVSIAYDTLGLQSEAHDAAGATTFLYDSFGSITNETVIGIAGTNTIQRFWDVHGRTTGYALNGTRQTTIGYNPDTGRIASMLANGCDTPFIWSYLPDSDLKSSLAYPNGLVASWQYAANGQLLRVCNAFPTNTISQYDFVYDVAGRRTAIIRSGASMSEPRTDYYDYNDRNELISATKGTGTTEYQYSYDDIGNRLSSCELGTNRTYSANCLNQYTNIMEVMDDFQPLFDDDGNQTLVKTDTGVWSVTYNGENRPVLWGCGSTNIVMSFDRKGRRVAKNNQRFVYDGYLQIANFEFVSTDSQFATYNLQQFNWNPTEIVATCPLSRSAIKGSGYYMHDGNKNVSEVVAMDGSVTAHYQYAPFGAFFVRREESAEMNSWCFSSEYVEYDSATIYYNYRHMNPVVGRWLGRDAVDHEFEPNVFSFINNRLMGWDILGERYGNPVTDPYGNPVGPSSPYDPGGAYNPYLEWYDLLPNCPCCIDISESYPRLNPEDANDKGWGNVKKANSQHPGATWEVRWVDPSGRLSQGQQCTYDQKGHLLTKPPAAGTPDMYSFDSDKKWDSHPILHGIFDLLPYKIYSNEYYFKHWPPNNGNKCPENP